MDQGLTEYTNSFLMSESIHGRLQYVLFVHEDYVSLLVALLSHVTCTDTHTQTQTHAFTVHIFSSQG